MMYMEICDLDIEHYDYFMTSHRKEPIPMLDYHFSNDFYRNIDAMIYTCGYENCAPGHSYGPILRNGYLIHYILNGAGIYKARGRLYRLFNLPRRTDLLRSRPACSLDLYMDRHAGNQNQRISGANLSGQRPDSPFWK